MATATLDPIARGRNMLLATRKRDGTWVSTPVNPVVEDDHVYFRTWATSGKAKRLRNFTEVRIAPADARGRRAGPDLRGRTRLLTGSQAEAVARRINRRFPLLQGVLVRAYHRLRGLETQHYVVDDIEPDGSARSAGTAHRPPRTSPRT